MSLPQVKNGKPPITLYGQLLWREFFYVAATRNPHFDRMKGNDICIKIPWDENPKALAKWAEGMTGNYMIFYNTIYSHKEASWNSKFSATLMNKVHNTN